MILSKIENETGKVEKWKSGKVEIVMAWIWNIVKVWTAITTAKRVMGKVSCKAYKANSWSWVYHVDKIPMYIYCDHSGESQVLGTFCKQEEEWMCIIRIYHDKMVGWRESLQQIMFEQCWRCCISTFLRIDFWQKQLTWQCYSKLILWLSVSRSLFLKFWGSEKECLNFCKWGAYYDESWQ